MSRLARLFGTPTQGHRTLDGFVHSLLQTFENSRPGLTAEMLAKGEVEAFFRDLYEKEVRLLRDRITGLTHLSKDEQGELFQRVSERIRKVVLPAYARLASSFTPRERNEFYLTPEELHGLERLAWGALGVALGAFVVWAPFIPLWSKEWVLVFAVGGLFFPSLRRYFALRRYQHELNDLVARTDDEIWRLDLGFMTSAWERGSVAGGRGTWPGRPTRSPRPCGPGAQTGQPPETADPVPRKGKADGLGGWSFPGGGSAPIVPRPRHREPMGVGGWDRSDGSSTVPHGGVTTSRNGTSSTAEPHGQCFMSSHLPSSVFLGGGSA
jgi:hypothetical protein